MAALADIVAYDGASTPVAHTFVADHVEYTGNDLIASWQEKTVGVPEYAQGSILLTRRKAQSGMTRIGMKVNLPVMESVSGQNLSGYTAAPKVAYVDSYEGVQWVHSRSLAQGRQNAKSIFINLMRNSGVTSPPVETGVLYDAQVRLVFPS